LFGFIHLKSNIFAGQYKWERVCRLYNQRTEKGAPYRNEESIRNKWRSLKNASKPTGDPNCPPNVVRAKRIQKEIEDLVGAFEIDDDDEIDGHGSDKSSPASSPVHARPALNSHIVQESIFPLQNSQDQDAQVVVLSDNDDNDAAGNDQASEEIEDDSDAAAPAASSPIANSRAAALPQINLEIVAASPPKAARKAAAPPKRRDSSASQASYVPPRLGMDGMELTGVLNEALAGRKKSEDKSNKHKIPTNPTHSKKMKLSTELQNLDEEMHIKEEEQKDRMLVMHESQKMQHIQEMKRLDIQNDLNQKKFEAEQVNAQRRFDMESQKFSALISAIAMGVAAFAPQMAQSVASLVANFGAPAPPNLPQPPPPQPPA